PLPGKARRPAAPRVNLEEKNGVDLPRRLGGGGQAKGAGAGVTPTAVGPDRHHLDIEEEQGGTARPVPPDRPQPPQDRGPLRVGATEFPLDAAKVDPPFWSTRRRCSRLMALTRRRRIAYARSLASANAIEVLIKPSQVRT